MIANLDNDVYIKALVDEAYATIFTGSTTNTVAQKKVKRIFEAEGCHIGASAKHDTWEDKNGSFESVDAFLSSDNSAGSVRDQLAMPPVTCFGGTSHVVQGGSLTKNVRAAL